MDWKHLLINSFNSRPVGYYPITFQDYILNVIGEKPLWEYEGFEHLEPKEGGND